MTTNTTEPVVLDGVAKSYGPVRAVAGIDLAVAAGGVVALLGPNGAGKSTTIAMLLGLTEPDSGRAALFGGPPERAVRAGRVGAMPQDGRLIGGVSVRELVAFARGAYARAGRDVPPLDELLETARLTGVAGRRADRLSGGQAQRVRFALAVAGNPDLLVLDEPSAGLDAEARRDLWAAVRGCAARGATVLFSTHYLAEADEFADRIVVVDRGRVVADGTSTAIKARVPARTVSLDLGDTPPAALDALPGVVGGEVRGGRAELHTTDSDATVRALADAGLLRGLEVRGASLEEAFLTLTADGGAR
ncbi:ABC transporter ATP-binding protein [Actinomadura atramentaria]|uniref:ABC transporter ATP-binding protein n=1 Tax=Actinomadura atramentaria TaxID=1990 RepID=UPI00039FB457|nr:ABC transporter ATP-binding protein [Actinomadura atramentaria]